MPSTSTDGQAAASTDGHVAHDAERLTSTRAWRAAAARDAKAAGIASPVPKVHLVRRLSAKRRVRQHAIVLVDVERHQSTNGGTAVQTSGGRAIDAFRTSCRSSGSVRSPPSEHTTAVGAVPSQPRAVE